MTALATPREVAAPARAAVLGVTRSVGGYHWKERASPVQAAAALAMAQRLGVPELLARLLAARGVEAAAAADMLDPTIRALMPDPSSLRDMDRGAERLAAAIMQGEAVALFGDYDVDGAASAALVQRFLLAHGRRARLYIPDRISEGYGPNDAAFAQLVAEGTRLILTLDCGTASIDTVAAAMRQGVDVVVVDHHLAGETLPPAVAVINPNRQDDVSGQGHLAAAGVTFLLLAATARVLREAGWYNEARPAPDLLGWLDLAALATVCDVVPLTGFNRALVAKGLQVLRRRANTGLRLLADTAGLAGVPTPYSLAFVLGPRINAGGRIGDASLGARLLATDDEGEAARIAACLERLNRERKAIEAQALEAAVAQAERLVGDDPHLPLVIATAPDWHQGVIGLIASRLVERFRRPAVAITWQDGGQGVGSARSVPGIDLGSIVRAALERGLLVRGGGHAMAAGLTVARDSFEALADFLRACTAAAAPTADTHHLAIDAVLQPSGCTGELLDLIERAGPYGSGHPQPRFAFAALACAFVKPVGDHHLRCSLVARDGERLEAVAFRAGGRPLGDLLTGSTGRPLHVAGHLRRDRWGGRERIELIIEDAATAGAGAG